MSKYNGIRHAAIVIAVSAACTRGADGGGADGGKEARATNGRIAGPVGSLYVDDGGQGGLPVVFVHSFAGSTAHWSAQLASISAHSST